MNKLTLLALIGSVQAHPRIMQMAHNAAKSYGYPGEMDFMSEYFSGPQCKFEEGDQLEDMEFLSQIEYNLWNSAVKGWYRESANPIPDTCHGASQLLSGNKKIDAIYEQLFNGVFFTITREEATEAATDMIDILFDTKEQCQYERTTNDFMDWCTANPGKCVRGEGVLEGLFDNSSVLMAKGMDLWNLMWVDDSCYTDE